MTTNTQRIAALEALHPKGTPPGHHTHPTPTPDPVPPTTTGYGPGVGFDTKNNLEIGRGWQAVSHRFVAQSSSPVVAVRWAQRFGPGGYSGGNGGTIRVSLQADSAGHPSGAVLGSGTYKPTAAQVASNQSYYDEVALSATLTPGATYHLVFENTDPAPATNWCSVNEVYTYSNPVPQPGFSDSVLVKSSGTWADSPKNTPVFDIRHADGAHDGNAYYEAMVANYGLIGGQAMVREAFTPKVDVTVQTAMVRVGKVSGTDPLTVTLAGASATIPASAFPVGTPGADATGGAWGSATFPAPITLTAGTAYSLRLSSLSKFYAVPARKGRNDGGPELQSRRFLDGRGEKSADGVTWAPLYPYDSVGPDLMVWLR